MDHYIDQYIICMKAGVGGDWAEANQSIYTSSAFHNAYVKRCKQKEKKDYHYMVTFTISPKLHPEINSELKTKIVEYITAQAERTGLHVKEMYYVEEAHKDGRPHWHASITTTKAIKKALFSYYQKLYGNIDFSRSKGKNNMDALAYMSKSNTPVQLK